MCIKCFEIHRTYKKECLGLKFTCFNERKNIVLFYIWKCSAQTSCCFYYKLWCFSLSFAMKFKCNQYTNRNPIFLCFNFLLQIHSEVHFVYRYTSSQPMAILLQLFVTILLSVINAFTCILLYYIGTQLHCHENFTL